MTSPAKANKRGGGRRRQDESPPSPANAEALLARLDQVVRELEGGELPLERALAHFEEGVRLVREGEALLASVEQRIEMLLADDRRVPFAEDRDYTEDPRLGTEGQRLGTEDEPDDEDPDVP